MSKFYGTVRGASQTEATRRGHTSINVSAQSYDGSLITRLYYNGWGDLMVELQYSNESSSKGTTVWDGSMENLINLLKGDYLA